MNKMKNLPEYLIISILFLSIASCSGKTIEKDDLSDHDLGSGAYEVKIALMTSNAKI